MTGELYDGEFDNFPRDDTVCANCEHTEDECKDCYPELGYKNDKLKRDTEACINFAKSGVLGKMFDAVGDMGGIGLTGEMMGVDDYNKGYAKGKAEMQKKIQTAIREIENKALDSTKYVACGLYGAIDIINKHIGETE